MQRMSIHVSLRIKENAVKLKDVRDEMSKELKNEIKDMRATYVLVVGDFIEDENDNNSQWFIVELGLYEVFSEIHEFDEFDENNRNGIFEYGRKCIDHVLGSEGIMNITERIELMECNKLVNSDHRGSLTFENVFRKMI